jgi:hypothetical protein
MSILTDWAKENLGVDLPDIDFNKALNLKNVLPSNMGDVVELWSTIQAVKNGNKTQAQLDEAWAASSEATKASLEMMLSSQEDYSEGGDAMMENLKTLTDEFGTFGQISPDIFDEFAEYLSTQRSNEESSNADLVSSAITQYKEDVKDLSDEDLLELDKLEKNFREMSDEDLTQLYGNTVNRDINSAAGAPNVDDYLSALELRDEDALSVAPDIMEKSRQTDEVASKFFQLRQANSDKAINEQYEQARVDLPDGMKNSTMAVQLEKARMNLAAEKANENLLAAFDDAYAYMNNVTGSTEAQQNLGMNERNMSRNIYGDSIGATTSNQSLGMNERNMTRNLRGDAVNENSVMFTNALAGGNYGQGKFSLQKGLDGMNLTYANTLNNAPIGDINSLRSMRNNTAMTDMNNALTAVSNRADVAQGYINNTMDIYSKPYSYTAGGYNETNTAGKGTIGGLSNNVSYAANAATQAGSAVGSMYDTLDKKGYFKNIKLRYE